MKSLLIAIGIIFVSQLQAREIEIFDRSVYEVRNPRILNINFVINEKLGRAWIEVEVPSADPESLSDVYRTKVEGLFYDEAASAVVLEHEGEQVTCAEVKVRGRSIFRTVKIKQTRSCEFKGEWYKVSYDDGFEIKIVKRYRINLVTK